MGSVTRTVRSLPPLKATVVTRWTVRANLTTGTPTPGTAGSTGTVPEVTAPTTCVTRTCSTTPASSSVTTTTAWTATTARSVTSATTTATTGAAAVTPTVGRTTTTRPLSVPANLTAGIRTNSTVPSTGTVSRRSEPTSSVPLYSSTMPS